MTKSSLYSTFETDHNLERDGIVVDYGDFRIRIASTGSGNPAYARYIEKKLKPVRRAMDSGTLSQERSAKIMSDVYAQTIILNWETLVDDEWKVGVQDREGKLLPFNKPVVEETLNNLPHLLLDLQEQANSMANFRALELETEGKNSPKS